MVTATKKKERNGASVVEDPLGEGRGEILLEDHLDGVGEGLEEAEEPQPEDRGPVGADPVLHDRALLALDPGQDRGSGGGPDQGAGRS